MCNRRIIIYTLFSYILGFGCLVSCSDDSDYIPPSLRVNSDSESEDVEEEDVYNEIDFTPHVDGERYDSYRGLVMAGYQGWFGAPGDGCLHNSASNTEWYHYRESEQFGPGVLRNSIDFWPDMSEYEVQYKPGFDGTDGVSKPFMLPDGTYASVYSACDESSVMLHFKWMQEYGIDGVFMQRFVGEVIDNPEGKDHFDTVLEHAMKASNQYQRAICVMYDLGGFMGTDTRNADAVLADALEIKSKYNLDNRDLGQDFYLYENEKPLIVLWGVGFNDGRAYTIDDVSELIDKLKENGFSIMLGVPTYWRSGGGDTENPVQLCNLIKEKVDIIMPWFVGRYDNNTYSNFYSLIEQDIQWCKTNNVEYAPLCYPGSADRHMHPNNTIVERLGGTFFWNQCYNCISLGAQMLYIAMFDEIDEGTAIYKCLNQSDVPSNVYDGDDYYVLYSDDSYSIKKNEVSVSGSNDWCRLASDLDVSFVGIEDGLPTDHYLWLAGQARSMLRGEIPLKNEWPSR